MKTLQKFIINHKFNNNTCEMIFYTVTSIMIFMHAIVSVNTTKTGTELAETTTLTKTLRFDLNKNPVIAQQSPKTSSSALLSSTLYSHHLSSTTMAAIAALEVELISPRVNYALEAKDVDMVDCKSLTSVWGDVDPNIFYICDTHTKKPLQLQCPEGRGFFMGLGYSGCIQYEHWPACVSVENLKQVVVCDSEHMQQPWETMNPNTFFVCLQETIAPTMLNCEPGKGFVHAVVGVGKREGGPISEIVGCANWEKWRSYMQCNEYY